MITVRKGNPEGIKTLDDVLSQGRRRGHPEPVQLRRRRAGTSWPSTAPLVNEGKSPDQALEGVKTLLEKAVAQPGSARDALAAFTQGQGDVLLGYENEAIKAENEGEDVEYVDPALDDPDRNPDRGHQGRLRSPPPKTSSSSSGPTPARKSGPKTATARSTRNWSTRSSSRPPTELFKISQFGGWGKVNDEFFDEETGSVAKIEGELGVSTSG